MRVVRFVRILVSAINSRRERRYVEIGASSGRLIRETIAFRRARRSGTSLAHRRFRAIDDFLR